IVGVISLGVVHFQCNSDLGTASDHDFDLWAILGCSLVSVSFFYWTVVDKLTGLFRKLAYFIAVSGFLLVAGVAAYIISTNHAINFRLNRETGELHFETTKKIPAGVVTIMIGLLQCGYAWLNIIGI
ncbi:hypothetical protein Ocin01_15721, partial [Orchesella cincta]